MISLPAGTSIWIAAGVTDLRRGFTGLERHRTDSFLETNPFSGHVFVFRGKRGDLIKLPLVETAMDSPVRQTLLERGRFVWPQADNGTVSPDAARNSRCCWKASTGEDRYVNGCARHRGIERFFAKMFAYLHLIVRQA